MKRERNRRRVAACGIRVRAKRLHHIAAKNIAFLVLRGGDCYLATTVGMAPVMPHATQRRRNIAHIGAIVFRREGDIGLLLGSWLRRQRTNRFAISAV